jgi:hypothetical protein
MNSIAPAPAEPDGERPFVVAARGAVVVLFVLACTLKIATARMFACDGEPRPTSTSQPDDRLAGR